MNNDVKGKDKKVDDTFSITMELERPLLYDKVDESIKNSKDINKNNHKYRLKALIGVLGVLIIGFLIWANMSYQPQSLAKESLISNDLVEVNTDEFITFTPKNKKVTKGFIFYPGAKVEPESYAPLCKKIAESGYEVAIVPMPLNLAVLGINKGEKIIEKYPNVESWAVGGHSLGGVMASNFAVKNNMVDGVVFLASYPMSDDLKKIGKDALSIWGSKDGVMNFKNLVESKEKLPLDTTYVEIEGGNHSQFGDYGKQNSDNDAIISEPKQLKITTDNIIKFINNIN